MGRKNIRVTNDLSVINIAGENWIHLHSASYIAPSRYAIQVREVRSLLKNV